MKPEFANIKGETTELRQSRRKKERREFKRHLKAIKASRNVGWDMKHSTKNSKSPPTGKELASVSIQGPTESNQDFELGIREFGEAIQESDNHLPTPRIEYIAIFKPFPYETSEEMCSVCETILKRYSPYNVFGLATGTPPIDLDFTNDEHVYAFAYHLLTTMREKNGHILNAELESRIRALS